MGRGDPVLLRGLVVRSAWCNCLNGGFMKFFVVEINEGGAGGEQQTRAEVITYLSQPRYAKYWRAALRRFETKEHMPGDVLEFPCGWIFCLNKK